MSSVSLHASASMGRRRSTRGVSDEARVRWDDGRALESALDGAGPTEALVHRQGVAELHGLGEGLDVHPDGGEARRLAGEIILLHRGAILESQPVHKFFDDPFTDAAKRFITGELLT